MEDFWLIIYLPPSQIYLILRQYCRYHLKGEHRVYMLPVCCASIQTCKYMKSRSPAVPNSRTERKTCLGFMTTSNGYASLHVRIQRLHCLLLHGVSIFSWCLGAHSSKQPRISNNPHYTCLDLCSNMVNKSKRVNSTVVSNMW